MNEITYNYLKTRKKKFVQIAYWNKGEETKYYNNYEICGGLGQSKNH